jgi:hypothetical protein
MDELFMIEKLIGEVQAVAALQFITEKEYIDESEVVHEVFEKKEEVQVVKKQVGEDGEEIEAEQEAPADGGEEGEKKAPAFNVEEYTWTVTDRRPKNLPQLFMQSKGIGARHEVRLAASSAEGGSPSNTISSSGIHESITKSLDEFCAKVLDLRNGTEKYLYQQIIFNLE